MMSRGISFSGWAIVERMNQVIFPKLSRIVKYGQGVLGLRSDDVLLASFPKSGNTWVRFFFCNLISLCEWQGRLVDWTVLDDTMPELGVSNLLAPWPHKSIPRIVKTHQNFWPIFKRMKSVLIVRDPRDVMGSYYHQIASAKSARFTGDFSAFIRDREYGLEQWFKHYRSWEGHASELFFYEDLRRADLEGFGRLLDCLGIRMDAEIVKDAVEKSEFKSIRSIEKQYGLSRPEKMKEGFLFTRKGESGSWKELFSERDLDYYLSLKRKYRVNLY